MLSARVFLVASITTSGLWAVDEARAEQFARSPARADARIYITNLKDGATVPPRFTVRFAADNIDVAPAGEARPNAGHFHVLIDSPLPPGDEPIPSDVNHLHFGRGQTETSLALSNGDHTLQLLMGDHNHMQHTPPVASPVYHVHVDAGAVERARSQASADAKIFFVGLDDGATIPTRTVVRFGASGITIAPAGDDRPNSGHFHLLIDVPAPDMEREIPIDPQHIHFGRGQSETELTLSPGPHTLQLLLGDHAHVPHIPPVASKLIHVTAVANATQAAAGAPESGRSPSAPGAAVYFIYPRDGAVIRPHTTIRFGLRNMGVAPAGVNQQNTGHHHLLIDVATPPLDRPIPNEPNIIHFGLGQTEKPIVLPTGKHRLQLIFGDYRHMPHDPPLVSERIEVTVREPQQRRHRASRR